MRRLDKMTNRLKQLSPSNQVQSQGIKQAHAMFMLGYRHVSYAFIFIADQHN